MNYPRIQYAALFAILFFSTAPFLDAGDLAVNPRYAVWANFKVGSSSTLSVDREIDNTRVHLEITRTLMSVTDDQVEVQIVTKNTTDGSAPVTVTNTIPAKAQMNDIKETGNREITAMGKTFHCKIWDATGENPNDASHSGMGDLDGGTKAVTYISTQVPGGIVERDAVNQDGKQMNYILTAVEVKQ